LTNKEKERFKCCIKSTQLIARQGIDECLGTLNHYLENQKNLDTSATKELIRKLELVENNLDESNNYIKKYFD